VEHVLEEAELFVDLVVAADPMMLGGRLGEVLLREVDVGTHDVRKGCHGELCCLGYVDGVSRNVVVSLVVWIWRGEGGSALLPRSDEPADTPYGDILEGNDLLE
jgi:hypothetical protein